MTNLVERLNGLWREVDALGGTAHTDFDVGYSQGVEQASLKLEAAGFTEGRSEAADEITRLQSALSVAQAQGEEFQKEILQERRRAEIAEEKADAEMLRVKACEHIACGDEDWQKLRNECPSTAAVATLRDAYEALQSTPPTAVGRVIEAARMVDHFNILVAQERAREGTPDTPSAYYEHHLGTSATILHEALAGLDGRKE